MGAAADNVAAAFGISRDRQDRFSLESHRRALAAAAAGSFTGETVPLQAVSGTVASDDGPRARLTAALMSRFPPVFAEGGTVTAGNSCFDADAAAAVVITSVERARELGAAVGGPVRAERSGADAFDPARKVGAAASGCHQPRCKDNGVEPGTALPVHGDARYADGQARLQGSQARNVAAASHRVANHDVRHCACRQACPVEEATKHGRQQLMGPEILERSVDPADGSPQGGDDYRLAVGRQLSGRQAVGGHLRSSRLSQGGGPLCLRVQSSPAAVAC
jgi:hypothetical protein